MATETQNPNAVNVGSTFVWHEVYGPDADAIVDFYTKALDFGSESMDMGPMGSYKMLTRNGKAVCGVVDTANNPPMPDIPPHWATYLSVDDVDARLAKCVELGSTQVVPPMDVPTVGRMALIRDPFGAHIWLFKNA
jgi:predicted enzyme related to lactoylglutathione lyase